MQFKFYKIKINHILNIYFDTITIKFKNKKLIIIIIILCYTLSNIKQYIQVLFILYTNIHSNEYIYTYIYISNIFLYKKNITHILLFVFIKYYYFYNAIPLQCTEKYLKTILN